MKKLLTLLLLFICIETIAQTPPPIRRPGEAKEVTALYNIPGNYRPGREFVKDQRNYSNDKRYCFVFQADGNLVIYRMYSENSYKAIWQTRTNGIAMKKCVFQKEGNLVMYGYNNKAIWDSFTDQNNKDKANESILEKVFGKGDTFTPVDAGSVLLLRMQNEGNIVIYYGSTPIWSSGSEEKY
ncbi:MAG: hypothetical protein ABIO05_01825 [Ferruginibacter sp.]